MPEKDALMRISRRSGRWGSQMLATEHPRSSWNVKVALSTVTMLKCRKAKCSSSPEFSCIAAWTHTCLQVLLSSQVRTLTTCSLKLQPMALLGTSMNGGRPLGHCHACIGGTAVEADPHNPCVNAPAHTGAAAKIRTRDLARGSFFGGATCREK